MSPGRKAIRKQPNLTSGLLLGRTCHHHSQGLGVGEGSWVLQRRGAGVSDMPVLTLKVHGNSL